MKKLKEENGYTMNGIELARIIRMAELIVAAAAKMPGNKGQGGYLVIRRKNGRGTLKLIERIGLCRLSDVEKCHFLGLEKGRRLSRNVKSLGHVSSHQSRNPEFKKWGKWGGAIVAGDYIISFSGFKELFDEAVVLVLGLKMGLFPTLDDAEAIGEISGSKKLIVDLYNLVGKSI